MDIYQPGTLLRLNKPFIPEIKSVYLFPNVPKVNEFVLFTENMQNEIRYLFPHQESCNVYPDDILILKSMKQEMSRWYAVVIFQEKEYRTSMFVTYEQFKDRFSEAQ